MKKLSIYALILLVFSFLTACGGGGGSTTETINDGGNSGGTNSGNNGQVANKPSALNGVMAIPSGSNAVSISFDAPAANENVTEYVVTCLKNGVFHKSMTSTAMPVVCTGLFPGATYSFEIAAKNSAGTGQAVTTNTAKAQLVMESSTPYIQKLGNLRIAGMEKADGVYLCVMDANYNLLRSGKIFGPGFYLNGMVPRQGTTLIDVIATQSNADPTDRYPTASRGFGTIFKAVVDVGQNPLQMVESTQVITNRSILGDIFRIDDENFFQFAISDNATTTLMYLDMHGNITYEGVPVPANYWIEAMCVTKEKLYLAVLERRAGYGKKAHVISMDRNFGNVVISDLAQPFVLDAMSDTIFMIKVAPSGKVLMSVDYYTDPNDLNQGASTILEVNPQTGAVKELFSNKNGVRNFDFDSQGNIYASLLGPSSAFVKLSPTGNLLWSASLLHPCQTLQILLEEEQGMVMRLYANYNDYSEQDYFAQTTIQTFQMSDGL